MVDPKAATIARAVSVELDGSFPEPLPRHVEAELAGGVAERYLDPVSLGSLIVSIASLAWTIYDSRRKKDSPPTVQILIRELRIEAARPPEISLEQHDLIIETTAREVIKQGDADGH